MKSSPITGLLSSIRALVGIVDCKEIISSALFSRRQVMRLSSKEQFATAASFCTDSFAAFLGREGADAAPLCMMALWNRSFDLGEIKCKATLVAPVPSPNTVTFLGSPPKRAILSRTHLNAIICGEKSN